MRRGFRFVKILKATGLCRAPPLQSRARLTQGCAQRLFPALLKAQGPTQARITHHFPVSVTKPGIRPIQKVHVAVWDRPLLRPSIVVMNGVGEAVCNAGFGVGRAG
jgi:hypothetical protein